jgi:hypothetical protein
VAGAAESSPPQTMHDATSTEEQSISGPQTVPHDTIGRPKKFVVGAIESSYPQTREEHLASLKELLDALFVESMAVSPRTVRHDTRYNSPTLVSSLGSSILSRSPPRHDTSYNSPAPTSSLGSSILSRSPPNWYEVFYIRMGRGGSFYMYPDLGGPFQCIDEADNAISRYLDERQCGSRYGFLTLF